MDISQEILSDITVYMKYARYLPGLKRRETWIEICERNIRMHVNKFPELESEIRSVYEQFVYTKKVLPSMRSMQFAGKPIDVNPTRIYNCAYLPIDCPEAFAETMFLLLGGTGVGYSVQRSHVDKLPILQGVLRPEGRQRKKRFLVGDSIEGWADAIKALMESYFYGKKELDFDFRDIRPKGALLITAGGKAPGPEPLRTCIAHITSILENALADRGRGTKLKPIECHDIVCHIADGVLAGGIRRSACLTLFSKDDQEMLFCKSGRWWEKNPQRARANNSACFIRGVAKKKDFKEFWEIVKNSGSGEPGIYWTNDSNWGTNPCCEIALRPNSFCNLCEINVSNIDSQEDLNARAKAAAFIGSLQASYTDFHYLRDIWRENAEKDALLGVSMTGIGSGEVLQYNLEEAAEIVSSENARVVEILGINKAARQTCIKPAGTTSLTLGCSSGIHAWHNTFYLRRMRVGKNEAIYTYLKMYHPELIEDEYFSPHDTAVIQVPQKAPPNAILRTEPAFDTLSRVKMFSEKWVTPGHFDGPNQHNVSCTVSIKDDEWEEIGEWMWANRKIYNGISVLPYDGGTYKQAPFEDITEAEFSRLYESLKNIDLTKIIEDEDHTDLSGEMACAGGACVVV